MTYFPSVRPVSSFLASFVLGVVLRSGSGPAFSHRTPWGCHGQFPRVVSTHALVKKISKVHVLS